MQHPNAIAFLKAAKLLKLIPRFKKKIFFSPEGLLGQCPSPPLESPLVCIVHLSSTAMCCISGQVTAVLLCTNTV